MGTYSVDKRFESSPEDTWAAISDIEHAADNIRGIKSCEIITDGPIGAGTKFRETRVMFKKEATEEIEITEWDPPRSYATECVSCGAHFRSTFTVRPDGDGSVVEITMDTKPLSFLAKLMSPLGGMMAKSCLKMVCKDLDDLKAVAEGGGGAHASPA